jgi:hypothetical protein
MAFILILLGLHEIYLRSREKEKSASTKKTGKKKR